MRKCSFNWLIVGTLTVASLAINGLVVGQDPSDGRGERRGREGQGGEGWRGDQGAQGGRREDRWGRGGGREQWNPTDFLNRLDRNRNGVLEPTEISDRSKQFLEGMGIDATKSTSIKKVVQKIEADRKNESDEKAKQQAKANRKIPGFGVEKEKIGVPGFADRETETLESIQQKYGDQVMGQVNSTLDRYDQNKNGMLDPEEIKQANWGAPAPEVTDRN